LTTLEEVSVFLQALHHFVMSCTPLDDGTVEIVCQQLESVMMFMPERKVKIDPLCYPSFRIFWTTQGALIEEDTPMH